METTHRILITFAVPQESLPFRRRCGHIPQLNLLVTGMGAKNAERVVRTFVDAQRPTLVISSGFAGGLNPELEAGRVVFETELEGSLRSALTASRACHGRFCCMERVLITAEEKRAARESSGCDAVEMESAVIRRLCREQGIPSATVRVISDSASEDLPLDFNRLMSTDMQLDYYALARELMRFPGKISRLLQFQRRVRTSAENLGAVLLATVERYRAISD